jgi:hypothetical protein
MAFDLGSLLGQYLGAAGGNANPQDATDHFGQVAQSASPDLLSAGLAAMFHSDQTPPFGQMAGQLFGQANGQQQAGMLGQLIASMGPQVLSQLAGGAAGAGLGGLLSQLTQGGDNNRPTLTPEQASQFTPEQVQAMAHHAQQNSPGVVEQMSGFYAEHSSLIKTVGGAALAIALAKMAQHQES